MIEIIEGGHLWTRTQPRAWPREQMADCGVWKITGETKVKREKSGF